MAKSLFSRPASTLALLVAAAAVAACGSEREPTNTADDPTQPSATTTPAAMPAEVAAPASEPAASQPAPTQTEPTGGLPLSPGVYVMSGSPCASPANAAFRIFDGRGISGSATRACRLTVRSREGDAWRVDQSCEDTYSGQRTTAAQTIRIRDSRSFTLTEAGEAGMTFRLCPAGEAPSYLQDMVSAG